MVKMSELRTPPKNPLLTNRLESIAQPSLPFNSWWPCTLYLPGGRQTGTHPGVNQAFQVARIQLQVILKIQTPIRNKYGLVKMESQALARYLSWLEHHPICQGLC